MDFKVRILGSSSALPTSTRFPTSQVVIYNKIPYLIDCAEGTQMQMRKFGIPFGRLKNIFISHMHGDHIYGIFGLLSSMNLLGRKTDINIYAPAKFKELYETVLKINNDQLKYNINFFALDKSEKYCKIFENKSLEVFCFPLKHSKPVFGFLFAEKQKELNVNKDAISEYNLSIKQILELKLGKDILTDSGQRIFNGDLTFKPDKPASYAFCTDTLPLNNLDEFIFEPDLLYHEATFANEHKELAAETYHSTAEQAAKVATKIKAKKLIIGHFSSRYKDMTKLLLEAKTIFQNTYEAYDGMEVDVKSSEKN